MGHTVEHTDLPAGFVLDQNVVPEADPLGVPEGFVLDQPDQPAAEAGPGFFSRVGERLSRRGDIFQEITAEPAGSTLESLSKGVQVLGNVAAGGAVDVIGETISTGFGLLSQGLSAVTPDFIEDPVVGKLGDAFEAVAGTEVAQSAVEAAAQGIEAYSAWAEENPEAAKIASAFGNMALLAPVVPKGARIAGPPAPTVVGRAGQAATTAGEAQAASQRATFVEGLVRPAPTKSVREAEILRSAEGGLVSGRTVTPSAGETAIAQSVTDIAGVKPSNTLLQNLGAVQEGIGAEAKTLAATLKASPVKIARPDMKSDMDGVLVRLADNPILVGDAAKTGERTVAQAVKFLQANPNTPAGVLKARQQFDEWVGKQRPKIFDPSTESALSIAVRETRQGMNDIIAKSVPDVGVKQSLATQSNMFRAIDNIAPKAAAEAETAIGRLGKRVTAALGLKREVTKNLPQIAGAAAVTGVGVAAPAIAAGLGIAGLGLAGAAKLAFSPKAKRAVGNLLRQSERAIQKAKSEGNKELVRQLRAERIAVVELMRNAETRNEQ